MLLRLYGPLEPWFDQTWRMGEVEMVKQLTSLSAAKTGSCVNR
jgi:hypothetical protein